MEELYALHILSSLASRSAPPPGSGYAESVFRVFGVGPLFQIPFITPCTWPYQVSKVRSPQFIWCLPSMHYCDEAFIKSVAFLKLRFLRT
jgi:hypothetical protein